MKKLFLLLLAVAAFTGCKESCCSECPKDCGCGCTFTPSN